MGSAARRLLAAVIALLVAISGVVHLNNHLDSGWGGPARDWLTSRGIDAVPSRQSTRIETDRVA